MKSWLGKAAVVLTVVGGFCTQSAMAQMVCMYQPGSAAQAQCEAISAGQQLEAQQQQQIQQQQSRRQQNARPPVNSWGAMAVDLDTNMLGTSVNNRTQVEAERNAMTYCAKGGSRKCQIAGRAFRNSCAALASGRKSTGGWFVPATYFFSLEEAEDAALKLCRASAQDCKIEYAGCSLP